VLDEVAVRDETPIGEFVTCVPKHHVMARTVASTLADGGIALVHSDLGYLLCADALDRTAVRRAVGLRQQGRQRPLGIVGDPDIAGRHVVIGRRARRLIRETWPGTLALQLPRRRCLPSWACAGPTATLLCPDGFFWRVAWQFGSPIAVALAAGRTCPDARRPCASLAAAVDLVVDGGMSVAVAPTVIDLTTARPRVAHDGGLFAPQRLRRLVPELA
jgi:L-threonylcarbamoyladenylate synthase